MVGYTKLKDVIIGQKYQPKQTLTDILRYLSGDKGYK